MREWLILTVRVPIILFPLVVLYGFAGCQLVFKAEPSPDAELEKSFEATLTEERPRANRCVVQRIEPVPLARSGGHVRIARIYLIQRIDAG